MQNRWAKRRKMIIGIVFVLILIGAGIASYFLFIRTPASCSDGKQNQNEKGVDCGGVCVRLCYSDIANPIVLWQRAFQVEPGSYSAVAYVQNPNKFTEAHDILYTFRLYDAKNALIVERSGHTFIPPNQKFAIFESGLSTGASTVARTDFSFTTIPTWTQLPSSTRAPNLSISNIMLANESSAPELSAMITNNGNSNLPRVEAVTILYNSADTAIAASRTIITNLNAQGRTAILFTWPRGFNSPVIRKEVLLRVYPQALLQ